MAILRIFREKLGPSIAGKITQTLGFMAIGIQVPVVYGSVGGTDMAMTYETRVRFSRPLHQ